MRSLVVPVMSFALILAGRLSAQLVFEPQLVGSSSGAAVSPRLDRGDVDGDGDLDVVFSTDVDSVAFGYEIFLNDGTGDLAFSSATSVSLAIKGLRLADVDGDTDVDLLLAQGSSINLRRGAGDGTFGIPQVVYTAASGNVTQLEVAGVSHVVFGHLHALDPRQRSRIGGTWHGVRYILAAVDFVGFQPVEVSPA